MIDTRGQWEPRGGFLASPQRSEEPAARRKSDVVAAEPSSVGRATATSARGLLVTAEQVPSEPHPLYHAMS